MTKFTSIQDYEEYMFSLAPILSKLDVYGELIESWIFLCFNKYYEIHNSLLKVYIPDIKNRCADLEEKIQKGKVQKEDIDKFNKLF
jgi:hypothetical protein